MGTLSFTRVYGSSVNGGRRAESVSLLGVTEKKNDAFIGESLELIVDILGADWTVSEEAER